LLFRPPGGILSPLSFMGLVWGFVSPGLAARSALSFAFVPLPSRDPHFSTTGQTGELRSAVVRVTREDGWLLM
jgi:hypothetical protein